MDSVGYTDRHAAIPDVEHSWESGKTVLYLEPETVYEEEGATLTWALWTTTLRGIRKYIQSYPGLFFAYEIYEASNDGTEEYYIGFGKLSQDVWTE